MKTYEILNENTATSASGTKRFSKYVDYDFNLTTGVIADLRKRSRYYNKNPNDWNRFKDKPVGSKWDTKRTDAIKKVLSDFSELKKTFEKAKQVGDSKAAHSVSVIARNLVSVVVPKLFYERPDKSSLLPKDFNQRIKDGDIHENQ
ncbi:MAG: hypothetical protein KAR20_04370 [Candidatus Heimdallarchaeota archaeon]|nr:hypothetical protein [Candidatus Heimdallarchaeota archaeon]